MIIDVPVGTDQHLSLLDLLVSRPGLPEPVRDILWDAADFNTIDVTQHRVPDPPSPATVTRLLSGASSDFKLTALGAALEDPALLHQLLGSLKDTPFGRGAGLNPHRSPGSDPLLPADSAGEAAERCVARAEAASFQASGVGDPDSIAGALIATGALDTVITSLSGTSDSLSQALWSRIVEAGHDDEGSKVRRFRRYVLQSLETVDRTTYLQLAALLAQREGGRLEADDAVAVADALADGIITGDDLVCRPNREAMVVCRLAGGALAELAQTDSRGSEPENRRRGPSELSMRCETYALISGEAAAARFILSSVGTLYRDEELEIVGSSDVETFFDWAERSLEHKPTEAMVAEALEACDRDRVAVIAEEAVRRPSATAANPVLALRLPGQSRRPIEGVGGQIVWEQTVKTLGDDVEAWKVLVGIAPDWDESIDNLLQTSLAVAHDEDH